MSTVHKWQACRALFRRYRDVFSFHWSVRRQPGRLPFNTQEAQFLPASLALQEMPVSPSARLLAWVMIAMAATLVAWACIGKIDIVVNAAGKIVPAARTKVVASVGVASVRALHVEEGQAVKAGDVLVELDATAFDTERDKASGDRESYELQAARSRALLSGLADMRPPRLPALPGIDPARVGAAQQYLDGQYADVVARLAKIDDDIHRYAQALPLARQRADDYRELAANRDVPYHAYLEREQARIDMEGNLAAARSQRRALVAEARRGALDALTEANRLATALAQDALRASSQGRLQTLRAPVNGTVQQLAVHTVGGVVPAAQPLMAIVPADGPLEIEAVIDNKDIGFVREGQRAEVKVSTFQYTKYGTIPARVTHVSRDAVPDDKKALTYLARVVLDRATVLVDGEQVPITAGMGVSVEIKTGSRRVVEYVLSPLLQHGRESLNER